LELEGCFSTSKNRQPEKDIVNVYKFHISAFLKVIGRFPSKMALRLKKVCCKVRLWRWV